MFNIRRIMARNEEKKGRRKVILRHVLKVKESICKRVIRVQGMVFQSYDLAHDID